MEHTIVSQTNTTVVNNNNEKKDKASPAPAVNNHKAEEREAEIRKLHAEIAHYKATLTQLVNINTSLNTFYLFVFLVSVLN